MLAVMTDDRSPMTDRSMTDNHTRGLSPPLKCTMTTKQRYTRDKMSFSHYSARHVFLLHASQTPSCLLSPSHPRQLHAMMVDLG